MSRLRVNAFGISIDGYGAGPDQDLANPMGVGGMALHKWVFGTKTFQKMHADFAARGFENVGAWILGRNMFGPMRGPWSDDSWKGWWGNNPQQPALPRTRLRAHAPCSCAHRDGGRNDVPLRDRWHPCRAETREGGGSGHAITERPVVAGDLDEVDDCIAPGNVCRLEQLDDAPVERLLLLGRPTLIVSWMRTGFS